MTDSPSHSGCFVSEIMCLFGGKNGAEMDFDVLLRCIDLSQCSFG